ncbi:hypothetical protein SCHPADRAFT_751803 [Schizopora paradoxa]|uniref:Uncharacterized protein n=1 Tax=Schizopora paradoxa TaxID=27342 RepID=A0A0H2RI80_9AGAM|nr:hypothetical protein SCHPADRAFT_751803 [Schizopora paradoxa]
MFKNIKSDLHLTSYGSRRRRTAYETRRWRWPTTRITEPRNANYVEPEAFNVLTTRKSKRSRHPLKCIGLKSHFDSAGTSVAVIETAQRTSSTSIHRSKLCTSRTKLISFESLSAVETTVA